MNNLLDQDITGRIGKEKYHCQITWKKGVIHMDEPESSGGKDKGPDPYSTFLASLAGCTLATLRMYIDRKEWNIPEIHVRLNMSQKNEGEIVTFIRREITFSSEIPADQKERLLLIAEKCPVSKILSNTIDIHTQLI
ncbi:MAG: OsmC family protein [Bacteroidia bacterium]|nr:OsmC family protein [Bacteroidia bacterium]